MNDKQKKEVNPFIIGGVLFGLAVVILLVISIRGLFKANVYGEETKIDNFNESYAGMAESERDLIFHQLYLAIRDNVDEGQEVPKAGALIRAGTAVNDYNTKTKVYSGNFVVDIAAVEQSFKIQFEWSKEENNQNLGGYPVVVSCLPADLVIYDGGCVDNDSGATVWFNEYQLAYTFGATKAATVQEMIEGYWGKEAGSLDDYEMTVDETSLTKLKDAPDYTYQFRLKRKDVQSGEEGWYEVKVWLEDFSNTGKVTVEVTAEAGEI